MRGADLGHRYGCAARMAAAQSQARNAGRMGTNSVEEIIRLGMKAIGWRGACVRFPRLLLALPAMTRAQFTFITENGAITITKWGRPPLPTRGRVRVGPNGVFHVLAPAVLGSQPRRFYRVETPP